ncbi:MAG TPA: DUF4233 domain-containing protein [Mycobacteriales bacterium]|jgi:hypothetical protein|nr:DUF4233 domain-containing protein [Mycobacteriales bacterium]
MNHDETASQSDSAPTQESEPGETDGPTAFVSGLRNPPAAVRGVGMATLLLETLVLLLALQPMRQLSYVSTPVALSVVGGLAVFSLVNAMLLRYNWGWRLGLVFQAAIVVAGFVHLALLVLGVIFLLIWLYVLRVRRTVLGKNCMEKSADAVSRGRSGA